MTHALSLQVIDGGIGRLTIDVPDSKVNILTPAILDELSQQIDAVGGDPTIKVLVIASGKDTGFIAGADIKEFTMLENRSEVLALIQKGQRTFDKIENLKIPTIAFIDGVCLGGGLELALSCEYRFVVDEPKTSLGLPEVKLGLIPGWGGTQRLPRLVGVAQGLGMILAGKAVDARKAYKIGLAEGISPRAFAEEELTKFIGKCQNKKGARSLKRRRPKGWQNWLLEGNPLGRALVFNQAEKNVHKVSKGKYPAPVAALRVIRESYGLAKQEGLAMEAEGIASLFDDPVAPNLIQLFFRSQGLKKQRGIPKNVELLPVKKAAVVGAGIMGSGIAWLFSKNSIPVILKDLNWKAVTHGMGAIRSVYQQLVKIRKMRPQEVTNKLHTVTASIDYAGFEQVDLVVEAVAEDLSIKRVVMGEIEDAVSANAIIATNTSALSVTEIARDMRHPDRFLGMHFFNPVNRMPLVEVVPGAKTSDEVLATVVGILHKMKKNPIVVKDSPGFLVNRVLAPFLVEAGHFLDEGADLLRVDRIIEDFGMPMGPFKLLDQIGLDVAYKACQHMEQGLGPRLAVPAVFDKLIDNGILGEKGKAGFFDKKSKGKKLSRPINRLLPGLCTRKHRATQADIVDRFILSMVNEAARCLEEGIVDSADTLDMAMILGTGFPPFRGGLLAYADERGIDDIISRLEDLSTRYDDRFAPSDALKAMRTNKTNFHHAQREMAKV